MKSIPDLFGCMVFDDRVMKSALSGEVYASLKMTIDEGRDLDINVANAVATAMKNWAISKGATHFTHWFQPLTGITAEKHDSFIKPSQDGGVIMEFSGKELIKGEPDASSFPSGGLRATFEARGYTAWDPTSYAFIKDNTLCIPTAFCSYCGEALDKKTPLLRSMEALNKQAIRILRLFGNDEVRRVKTMVGVEQEYFLITKEMYDKRPDLRYTGRTLFGSKPPKSQEMNDHYFGTIKPRVASYMQELDEELWKLGIYAKTEHNEVAPAQHELAPIYVTANVATDHNQLMMEIMQKVAFKHNLVCLLHEKPFDGVNGSGKHNNWSMVTDTGINLLSPGETPHENLQFLLFLCAVIKAVDDYQDLLRISVATAGNDHRLGANEAPPAVVSIFLGDELSSVLDAIEKDKPYAGTEKIKMKLGVNALPKFNRDTTDRNRTSPFAFTGNKFEFRMLGSNDSIACANVMLNTAVAEVLSQFASVLECEKDFSIAVNNLIHNTIKKHKRIIFNGNGYSDDWIKEAEKRGLMNLETTPEAFAHLCDGKNSDVLKKHGIFNNVELHSRYEIYMENYEKINKIEALTMIDMARKLYLPAAAAYGKQLADSVAVKSSVGVDTTYETDVCKSVSELTSSIYSKVQILEKAVEVAKSVEEIDKAAFVYKDSVIPAMKELRSDVDTLEGYIPSCQWPVPGYGDLLFSVR